MTDQELDDVYTATARALGTVGKSQAEWYLARLTLLLMQALDDPVAIHAAIAAAREDFVEKEDAQ